MNNVINLYHGGLACPTTLAQTFVVNEMTLSYTNIDALPNVSVNTRFSKFYWTIAFSNLRFYCPAGRNEHVPFRI